MLFTSLVLQDHPHGYILSCFFQILRVLSLQKDCRIFSDLYIPASVENFFQFMVFTFLENVLEPCIFTHALVTNSKLQVEVFENLFPQRRERGGRYDLLYQNSVRKYEDDQEYQFIFSFCMICNFSKYDGFTILKVISIKQCEIKFITSSLQPW